MSGHSLYPFAADRCPHCREEGIVFFDDRGKHSIDAEPCPMCELGRRVSRRYATRSITPRPVLNPAGGRDALGSSPPPAPPSTWRSRDGRHAPSGDYYHGVMLNQLSWNRGLTVWHRWVCATMGCFTAVSGAGDRCLACMTPGTIVVPPLREIIASARRSSGGGVVMGDTAEDIELAADDASDAAARAARRREDAA